MEHVERTQEKLEDIILSTKDAIIRIANNMYPVTGLSGNSVNHGISKNENAERLNVFSVKSKAKLSRFDVEEDDEFRSSGGYQLDHDLAEKILHSLGTLTDFMKELSEIKAVCKREVVAKVLGGFEQI